MPSRIRRAPTSFAPLSPRTARAALGYGVCGLGVPPAPAALPALLCALCLSSAPSAFAQEPPKPAAAAPKPGADDFEFGQGLADRGYYDLAREVAARLAAAPAEERKVEAALLEISIGKSEIDRERDGEKQLALVEAAAKAVDGFLEKHKAHRRTDQAKFDKGELLQKRGEILNRLAERAPADKRRAFREQAAKQLAATLDYFKELIEVARKLAQAKADDEAAQHRYMMARYYYGTALFEASEQAGDNEKAQDARLREMIKHFLDMMWDIEGYLLQYDVAIYMGRAYTTLDNPDEAARYFDMATGMAKLPEGKQYPEIPQRGFYYKAKALNAKAKLKPAVAKKYHTEALKTVDELFRIYPNAREEDLGLLARIERGVARIGIGEGGPATQELRELAEKHPKIASLVNAVLSGGGRSAPVTLRLRLAEMAYDRGDFAGALKMYRAILPECRGADAEAALPAALYKYGRCWYDQRLFFEAYLVFSRFEDARLQKDPKIAANAAWDRMRSGLFISELTQDAKDRDRYQKDLDDFLRKYPNDPRQKEVILLRIDGLKSKGDWKAAIEMYGKIPADSPAWEKAQYGIPDAWRTLGESLWSAARSEKDPAAQKKKRDEAAAALAEAEKGYGAYAARVKGIAAPNEIQRANVMAARYFLAKTALHEAVNRPDSAVAALANYEKDYPAPEDASRVVPALDLRIRALLAKGDISGAERTAEGMKALNADDRMLARTWYSFGRHYDEQAEGLQKTDPKAAAALAEKATDLYYRWVLALPDSTVDQLDPIGNRLFKLGKDKQDPAVLRAAAELYTRVAVLCDAGQGGKLEEGKVRWKAAQAYHGAGDYEQAFQLYERLAQQQAGSGAIREERADVLLEWARATKTSDPAKAKQRLEWAREALSELGAKVARGGDDYWRLNYKYATAGVELGAHEEVRQLIDGFELRFPGYDNGKYKDLFEKMKAELDRILPSVGKKPR